eukprot:scaffold187828_cov18-Tisochrysis_lutea.AAC.1
MHHLLAALAHVHQTQVVNLSLHQLPGQYNEAHPFYVRSGSPSSSSPLPPNIDSFEQGTRWVTCKQVWTLQWFHIHTPLTGPHGAADGGGLNITCEQFYKGNAVSLTVDWFSWSTRWGRSPGFPGTHQVQ